MYKFSRAIADIAGTPHAPIPLCACLQTKRTRCIQMDHLLLSLSKKKNRPRDAETTKKLKIIIKRMEKIKTILQQRRLVLWSCFFLFLLLVDLDLDFFLLVVGFAFGVCV
jgi:hypothetical protein